MCTAHCNLTSARVQSIAACRHTCTCAKQNQHRLEMTPAILPLAAAARSLHTQSFSTSTAATQQHRPAAQTAAVTPLPPGPQKGSDVPRINIGVFGVMNAGKSTLMNAITRQETSIVDATPGTTAGLCVCLAALRLFCCWVSWQAVA